MIFPIQCATGDRKFYRFELLIVHILEKFCERKRNTNITILLKISVVMLFLKGKETSRKQSLLIMLYIFYSPRIFLAFTITRIYYRMEIYIICISPALFQALYLTDSSSVSDQHWVQVTLKPSLTHESFLEIHTLTNYCSC